MGGAEAVLCDLISSMDRNAFEHVVIYIHDGPHRECLASLGVAHYQVRGVVWPYDLIFFIQLLQRIKKIKPDCIHTLLWAANVAGRMAGKLLGIPVVSAWHNNLDQDGKIRNFLDRLTYGLAAKHIAVSQGVVESAERLGFNLNEDRVQVITNGINIPRIQALSRASPITRLDLGLSQDHFVIGSVGRFMPVKRYDLMLDAFALLHKHYPKVRLVLVGIGQQEELLRSQARELGVADAVTFIVGQPSGPYYPLFDCFSLGSDKEGVSIALLEAMSFGLPCIVTHTGQYHAVIEQGANGQFVPAGNAAALAEGWAKLIIDKDYAQRLGKFAYESVQLRFSSARMCSEYERVLRGVFDEQIKVLS